MTNSTATPPGGAVHPDDHPFQILEAIPVGEGGVDGGWFGKVGTTVVLLLGTFGNAMTVLILRRLRSGWSALTVYLTALALSDTVMLVSGALPVWALKVLAVDVYASHAVVCKLGVWAMNASASLSAWVLVALTAQRAASVVWPHRVNVICTRHKSVVIVVVIAVLCGLLYSHTLFGYEVVKVGNGTSQSCTFASVAYQEFWVGVWVRVDMFVYSVLPCACLLCSNAVLGWKLALSVKHADETFSATGAGRRGHGQDRSLRKKKASAATVTIVIVSTAFVVITLPTMTYNTVHYDYASDGADARDLHRFLFDFFFVFGLSNFGLNFYLYCLTGSKFRAEFRKVMVGCCCQRPASSSRPAVAGSAADVTGESQVSEVSAPGGRQTRDKDSAAGDDDDF